MFDASPKRFPALPPRLRRPLGAVSAVCAPLVVLLGVIYAGSDAGSPLDDWATKTLADLFPGAVPFALLLDAGGEPRGVLTIAAVLAAICLVAGRRRLAVLAVASQVVLGAVTGLVKPIFDRTIHGGFLAYPSGHTAGATGFAIVVALLLIGTVGVGRPVALAIIAAVTAVVGGVAAWAQTLLVAHYMTDTVGGFLMAVALIPPTAMLIDRIADRLLAAWGPSAR